MAPCEWVRVPIESLSKATGENPSSVAGRPLHVGDDRIQKAVNLEWSWREPPTGGMYAASGCLGSTALQVFKSR